MKINRRNFLKLSMSTGLATAFVKAKTSPETAKVVSTIGEALNPTFSGSILSIWTQVQEGKKIIQANTQEKNNFLSQKEKNYSSADAYAHSAGSLVTYSLALTSRLPVETIIKLLFPDLEKDKLSQVTTITAFHAQTQLTNVFTTFFNSEMRSVLISLLENNKYKNNPLNIPPTDILNKFIECNENRNQRWKAHLEACFPALKSSLSRRDLLDLSITLSTYPISMLLNTGTARAIGCIPRFAGFYRNLLEKEMSKNSSDEYKLQEARALGNLILIPGFNGIGGGIQEVLTKINIFDFLSPKAQSHVKDLTGMLAVTYLYQKIKVPLQIKLENSILQEQKENNQSPWISYLSSYLNPKLD